MSKLLLFQGYSQRENWVTNNTLLLLSYLQRFSTSKFESVLSNLMGAVVDLKIGVEFKQQIRSKKSVVDGHLEQDGFKLAIETKLYDNFDESQLKDHLKIFDNYIGKGILLSLSKNKTSALLDSRIIEKIKQEKYGNVKFISTSYKKLITTIREHLNDWDDDMHEVLQQYEAFCEKEELFDYGPQRMLAVTINQSYRHNLMFNLYYDPADRNHNQNFAYLGLYADKEIKAIGKVTKTVYCDYVNGKLVPQPPHPLILSPDERERIIRCIEQTKYYDLRTNTKFILVDGFVETHFVKSSPYPIRQKQYLYLEEKIPSFKEGMSAKEVANALDGKEF
jgi:hypothetical protein